MIAKIVPEDSLYAEDLPADHPNELALIEEGWLIQFICPCGCGDTLHLATAKSGSPRWDYKIGPNKELTLHPSINRTVGCRSHFFVREGKIVWC